MIALLPQSLRRVWGGKWAGDVLGVWDGDVLVVWAGEAETLSVAAF